MGAIFSPCLAVAWLLSSRLALSHCESVLSGSVLRRDDVDGALAGGAAGAGAGREASTRRASCLDRVLQGLAALEVSSLVVPVLATCFPSTHGTVGGALRDNRCSAPCFMCPGCKQSCEECCVCVCVLPILLDASPSDQGETSTSPLRFIQTTTLHSVLLCPSETNRSQRKNGALYFSTQEGKHP